MKKILVLFCIIMTLYAVWFPLTYFKSNNDKKEIRVSHIFTEKKEDIDKIQQELESGKSFEDLIINSECPSKDSNGDIGYVQRGRYDVNFEDEVFNAKEKEITKPVESKFGWHIIRIDEIKYYSDKDNFEYNKYKYLDL